MKGRRRAELGTLYEDRIRPLVVHVHAPSRDRPRRAKSIRSSLNVARGVVPDGAASGVKCIPIARADGQEVVAGGGNEYPRDLRLESARAVRGVIIVCDAEASQIKQPELGVAERPIAGRRHEDPGARDMDAVHVGVAAREQRAVDLEVRSESQRQLGRRRHIVRVVIPVGIPTLSSRWRATLHQTLLCLPGDSQQRSCFASPPSLDPTGAGSGESPPRSRSSAPRSEGSPGSTQRSCSSTSISCHSTLAPIRKNPPTATNAGRRVLQINRCLRTPPRPARRCR